MREQLNKDRAYRNPEEYIGIDFYSFPAPFENEVIGFRENEKGELIMQRNGVWQLVTNDPNHYITKEGLLKYTTVR